MAENLLMNRISVEYPVHPCGVYSSVNNSGSTQDDVLSDVFWKTFYSSSSCCSSSGS